jgi:hypothetical protein
MNVINIPLKPWVTPNFVVGDTAPTRGAAWPLKDVDAEVLAQLCDDFRAEVFRKAGKDDPAK